MATGESESMKTSAHRPRDRGRPGAHGRYSSKIIKAGALNELLRLYGHDALSVIDQQLAGRPDPDVARVCQAEKRAFMTLDLDVADVRAYPPNLYSGLVVW
jgi:hypothetical protein